MLIFFWVGVRYGVAKCSGNMAVNNVKSQLDIFILEREVNAESFNRGVDDIRHILRKKYTIAE